VHIDREDLSAKFWLVPVSAAANFGFSARELRLIEALVTENKRMLIREWNDFFGN
jgi:hypothetical protein